mmetsp:Transcript_11184/g.33133  ORF Transcript_11184/g.33133 Transcript_11184/m.33133 type:complete len:240 (-) Transcript_11184:626-1345(-)
MPQALTEVLLQLDRLVMLRTYIGTLAPQPDERPQGHLGPLRQVVTQEQAHLGEVIEDVLFVIPLEGFEGHVGDGLLGHDNELSHRLSVQPGQGIIGVPKRISGILQAVPVVPESVHPAHHPHGPQVDLNLANVLLQLQIDDAIPVPPRLGAPIGLKGRNLDPPYERTERIPRQFEQRQQRREVLHDQQCAAVIRHLENVPLVLLLGLPYRRADLLHGTDAHLLHPQRSREGLADLHQAR